MPLQMMVVTEVCKPLPAFLHCDARGRVCRDMSMKVAVSFRGKQARRALLHGWREKSALAVAHRYVHAIVTRPFFYSKLIMAWP